MKVNFLDRFSKTAQISSFINIRPVGAELFHADGRTDGNDEAQESPFAILRSHLKIYAGQIINNAYTLYVCIINDNTLY